MLGHWEARCEDGLSMENVKKAAVTRGEFISAMLIFSRQACEKRCCLL